MAKKIYTVWVNGAEVNLYRIYVRDEAEQLANTWREQGYKDVMVTFRKVEYVG